MYVPSHCLDKSEPVEQEGRLWSAVHSFGSIFLLTNFVNLRKAIIVAVLHARNFVNNIFVIQEVARCETASSGGPQLFWPPTVRKRKRASWGDEASQNVAVWLLFWSTSNRYFWWLVHFLLSQHVIMFSCWPPWRHWTITRFQRRRKGGGDFPPSGGCYPAIVTP